MEFRIVTHSMAGRPTVEVWKDDEIVAAIHSHDDGIRVVSKYLDGVEHETGYPPAVVVHLSKGAAADEG
ncbi:hypothetical protein ES703_17425 [subsurface metagenome]